jgi:sugar O-acyltransferase (sialic acid O-acetyltransferase NeuD family)
MKELIIIGAGGFGREVYDLSLNSLGYNETFVVKGFLDDRDGILGGFHNYPPILSSVENYKINKNDVFICALGNGQLKQKYVDKIKQKGGVFISLLHKSSKLGQNTIVGQGCIITQNVIVTCDVKIGNFVTLQPFVNISHDCVIGNYCHLNSFVVMGGGSSIGDFVTAQACSVLLPGAKVANNTEIGACSAVV